MAWCSVEKSKGNVTFLLLYSLGYVTSGNSTQLKVWVQMFLSHYGLIAIQVLYLQVAVT